ncbi:hypothetical protein [Cohnella massiliensis]|uniref:hypothetical protein n=1 Tax=Cohnella massiliensis TaxID=1816691 RepID=UPI00111AB38C|nr:hypothetical protein [Cohnella massiliensis]
MKANGINYDSSVSLQTIEKDLATKKSSFSSDLQIKIEQLQDADYVYLSDSGDVYSSKRGYLGKADKIEENNISDTSSSLQNSTITPLSQSNPTVSEIFGGTTGAFERRQLGSSGFNGIISNVTLPTISNVTVNEQPWVYYGFENSVGALEGGYAYQTGSGIWLPYIKNVASGYLYADSAYAKSSGTTVNNFKFYIQLASGQTYYTAYLVEVGATNTVVRFASTPWTSISDLSVKRVTSIGQNNFNGSDILTKSMNQKWDSVQVSKYNSGGIYTSWSAFIEYSEWKNNMWYGTIDCTSSYVHRSNGYVSLYL